MALPAVGRGEPSPAGLSSSNPLTRKLSNFAPQSLDDHKILDAPGTEERRFHADVDIVAEGMAPQSVFLVKEGMVVRYRALPDGRRQIITFLIPGDVCDLHVFLVKARGSLDLRSLRCASGSCRARA